MGIVTPFQSRSPHNISDKGVNSDFTEENLGSHCLTQVIDMTIISNGASQKHTPPLHSRQCEKASTTPVLFLPDVHGGGVIMRKQTNPN